MTLKLGMRLWLFEYYQIYSNDDPRLTLTYFTAKSNLVPFLYGKYFQETIEAFEVKIGTYSKINEYMTIYDNPRSITDLSPRSLRFNISSFPKKH